MKLRSNLLRPAQTALAITLLCSAALPLRAETIPSLKGITQVATGDAHACALREDRTIHCWGSNAYGQIGNNTYSTHETRPVPVVLDGSRTPIEGATAIAAGGMHTCLLYSGMVSCWGNNGSGQIGDGSRRERRAPKLAVVDDATGASLEGAWAISAGHAHTCAIVGTGIVKCWGSNNSGQLGDDSRGTDRLGAVEAPLLTNAVAIATGMYHTCALRADSRITCWGRNDEGQLGDGTFVGRLSPATTVVDHEFIPITDAVAITAGALHTCALRSGGTVSCWGGNASGQLGNGTRTNRARTADVAGVTTATAVVAGRDHTCAVMRDTTAKCWGSGHGGKLGAGWASADRAVVNASPVLMDDSSAASLFLVKALATGGDHTCALGLAGSVFCWGENAVGQFGEGTLGGRRVTAF